MRSFAYNAELMWKGTEYHYVKVPDQLRIIDIPCNALARHMLT